MDGLNAAKKEQVAMFQVGPVGASNHDDFTAAARGDANRNADT